MIENTVETFKGVQDKGSGVFTGYDQVPRMLKNGKWFEYDDETGDFTIPSSRATIFSALKWTNNPRIMDYLKIDSKEKKTSKKYDPLGGEITIEQMKNALPITYDWKNKSDEEVRKLYKKWVKSLMPKRK